MTLSDIIAQMRALTGISDLALDTQSRACRLVFGETDEVEFEESPNANEAFFMHAIVGPLPRSASADAFASLLQANLFGLETGAAQLGYDDQREEVILFQRMDGRVLDMPGFTAELERFLGVLRQHKQKLRDGQQPAGRAEPPPGGFTRV